MAGKANEQPREIFKGVVSTSVSSYIGAGATKRKVTKEAYYYGEENETGVIVLRPLNANFVPTGEGETIDRDQLVQKYKPEPEIFSKKTVPALKALRATVARAERLRKQGEPFSAEFEFKNALQIDDTNIRATFGLGLTYLDRGETHLAAEVMKELVGLGETFHSENKHMFNEFGIKLRKNAMFAEAMLYYGKALELSPDDENLRYNIARTCYEMNDLPGALQSVETALALRPNFEEARSLKAVVENALSRKQTE